MLALAALLLGRSHADGGWTGQQRAVLMLQVLQPRLALVIRCAVAA